MSEPDRKNINKLFERLNLITAGEKTIDGLAAVQDLYCAMICIISENEDVAHEYARAFHDDVQATIRKNFDWYKSQSLNSPNVSAGRG
jgi:hypothetical protein